MRYFTKQWYELCQRTFLHFDLKICKEATCFCEELYQKLYKREERKYIKLERDIYNVDISELLLWDGMPMVDINKFLEGYLQEDIVPLVLSDEQKEHNRKIIEQYINRLPFDKEKIQKQFAEIKNVNGDTATEVLDKIPDEIRAMIADKRVFVLGYATKQVINLLKQQSIENERLVKKAQEDYSQVAKLQEIPMDIVENFCFHDCAVTELLIDSDIKIKFDNKGGFTSNQNLIFKNATIAEMDEGIVNAVWLYQELYKTETGYEAHILFWKDKYLTINCTDILVF